MSKALEGIGLLSARPPEVVVPVADSDLEPVAVDLEPDCDSDLYHDPSTPSGWMLK